MDLHEAIDRLLLTGKRAGRKADCIEADYRYALELWRGYCRLVESGGPGNLVAVREAFRVVRNFTDEQAAKLGLRCTLCQGTACLIVAGQRRRCPRCQQQCEVESLYRDLGGEG